MVKIGVLGGIGPEASALFYSKLIEEIQVRKLVNKNEDYPQIIINSINAIELTERITEKDLMPYIKGLEELDSLNPDFIIMVCNTIHLYFNLLQSKIKTRIINLPKEVESLVIQRKINKIFLIGTENTLNSSLYKFQNIETLTPNQEEQKILTYSIVEYNKGKNKEYHKKNVLAICNKYLSLGAQSVLMGCTEFAVMLKDTDIPKINTIEVMINSTIRRFN